jgi:hypothetical protein
MNFEASGNFEEWPPNEPNKPTQVAIYGTYHPQRGKCCEVLWTGQFPDLEKAMYWGGKKELEAIRKRKFMMASRVLWQHDLTPEQAVAVAYKRMEPQMDQAIQAMQRGSNPIEAMGSDPNGPLKPIDYSKVHGFVVDLEPPDEDDPRR